MSEDKPKLGLEVPDHIQERGRGLTFEVRDNQPPKPMADHLKLYDDDRNPLSGHEILKQMLAEMQLMATTDTSKPTATSMAADYGLRLARIAQELASDDDLAPEGAGHTLMLTGYLYGMLAMPNRGKLRKLSKHFETVTRQKAGPQRVKAEQERGRRWLREKAFAIWNQDQAQEKRISAVANDLITLMNKMNREEIRNWPQKPDAIKKAIRPVAPDYALKGGRPPQKG